MPLIELLSSTAFAHKRLSYMLIKQAIAKDKDFATMVTNYLLKEMHTLNPYQISAAVDCCAHLVNSDMLGIVDSDIVKLCSHSKIFVRKRALLMLIHII